MKNLKSRFQFTISLVVTLLIGMNIAVKAQDAKGYISIEEPPPIMHSGKLVEMFADFRDKPGSLVFHLESDAKVVPVSFQTTVKRNGKLGGSVKRKPMPYFPGEMIMCPEAFDFISLLYQVADNGGILPQGDTR